MTDYGLPKFEDAWATKGYEYGEDALENVKVGYELAREELHQIMLLEKIFWDNLVSAANESNWIPEDYCMNDWVSDCALFLREGSSDWYQMKNKQLEVGLWLLECFGEEIAEDKLERADRFIEEALELAQTNPDFNAVRAHALVDYVFNRDVGEPVQEVGGVMVTLAALCNTVGIDVQEAMNTEVTRIWTKVEQIRAKQKTKPVGSALPIPPKEV